MQIINGLLSCYKKYFYKNLKIDFTCSRRFSKIHKFLCKITHEYFCIYYVIILRYTVLN